MLASGVNHRKMEGILDLHTAVSYGQKSAGGSWGQGGAEPEIVRCVGGEYPLHGLGGQFALNEYNEVEWTPLHVASWHGRLSAVQKLLTLKADPYAITGDGSAASVLHLAAQRGRHSVAQWLLRKMGSAIDWPNSQGQTALYIAAWAGHLRVVKALVHSRASFNIDPEVTKPRHKQLNPYNTVQAGCRQGHVKVVKFMLKYYHSLRLAEAEEALLTAAAEGHVNCVEALLEERTPCLWHWPWQEWLTAQRWSPGHSAAHEGQRDMVAFWLQVGTERQQVATQPEAGMCASSPSPVPPPVHVVAAQAGHFDVVRLIQHHHALQAHASAAGAANGKGVKIGRSVPDYVPLNTHVLNGHVKWEPQK